MTPEHERPDGRLGRGALAGITALVLVGLLMGSSVGGSALQPGSTRGVEAAVVREITASFQRAVRRVASPDNHRPVAAAFRVAALSGDAVSVRPRVMRVGAHVPSRVRVAHLDLPPPALV